MLKQSGASEGIVELISTWIENFEQLQDRFLDLDYRLPAIYMARVDSMRERGANEQPIRRYHNEQLREMVWLQVKATSGWWSPITRKELDVANRSSYLDCLQSLANDGCFNFLGKDISLLDVQLDPNLIIYSRWKLNDQLVPGLTWREFLAKIEAQKTHEAGLVLQRVGELMPSSSTAGYAGVVNLLLTLAEAYGFRSVLVEKGGKPRIVLETPITDKLSMYLEWEDFQLFRKWGNLDLRFVIRESDAEIWNRTDKVPFFCIGLGNLIAGGDLYLNTRGEWGLIALALFAHADFMRCVAAATKSVNRGYD